MMDWLQHLPWGSILTATVTLALAMLSSWGTYLVFKTRTEIGLKIAKDGLVETNQRFSDLAAGVSQLKTEVAEFKQHVERHYVEKDEIAELKLSFERSIDRMQQSLDIATATMGDVRDAVLVMTAKGAKPSVPPARRRATTKAGA